MTPAQSANHSHIDSHTPYSTITDIVAMGQSDYKYNLYIKRCYV